MPDGPTLPRPVLLGAFALSGAAALSYEVVWTRSLSLVLGSTTYAVSAMLATFMLGLAVGGFVGGRLADRSRGALLWLGGAELGIGALGITSLVVIESLPAAYLVLYRAVHLSGVGHFAVQMGICGIVMLGPTVLMGMTFPLVTRALVGGVEDLGSNVGIAYGINTLGSVVGAITTGFVLIPGLGLRGAALVAAGLNLVVGSVVLLRSGVRASRLAPAAVLFALFAWWASSTEREWALVNFYTAERYLDASDYDVIAAEKHAHMDKLYERDGVGTHVSAFRTRDGFLLLEVGGRIEGTGRNDVSNALLLAYLPAAAHPSPERVLVVGLGAGVTLEAARRVAPKVELAEIEAAVLEAVRAHGPRGVLDGVTVHEEDARNFLLRTEERFDVITSEPSWPTDYSVANLFSREFYALSAARLRRGGVFCQWLPYYMLTNDDVTMMVKTFGSVFPYASLWRVGESMDLLLLGTEAPFARSAAEITQTVKRMNGDVALHAWVSRTPEQVAEIVRLRDVPVNTDDRPLLEFRLARNLRIGDLSALER